MAGITILRADGSSLTFDATTAEDFAPGASVTEHPVEDGGVISDHVQVVPIGYTATCVLTESPLVSGGLAQRSGVERIQAARTFLWRCQGEVAPSRPGPRGDLRLLIGTLRYGALQDMILTSWRHTVTTRREAEFELVFKQIRIARGVSITIPVDVPRTDKQASFASRTSSGAQSTSDIPITDPRSVRDRSILFGIKQGLVGALGG